MTDFNKYYNDFRLFNARLQRYLKNHNLPKCEYISTVEFQRKTQFITSVILY